MPEELWTLRQLAICRSVGAALEGAGRAMEKPACGGKSWTFVRESASAFHRSSPDGGVAFGRSFTSVGVEWKPATDRPAWRRSWRSAAVESAQKRGSERRSVSAHGGAGSSLNLRWERVDLRCQRVPTRLLTSSDSAEQVGRRRQLTVLDVAELRGHAGARLGERGGAAEHRRGSRLADRGRLSRPFEGLGGN
jgi:hypothetical protein